MGRTDIDWLVIESNKDVTERAEIRIDTIKGGAILPYLYVDGEAIGYFCLRGFVPMCPPSQLDVVNESGVKDWFRVVRE